MSKDDEADQSGLAKAQSRSRAARTRQKQVPGVERTKEEERLESLRRRLSDDADFWFRRIFTSLGIANVGAFAALSSGFLQSEDKSVLATVVANSLTLFALGTCAAGAIPVLLWGRAEFYRNRLNETARAAEVEANFGRPGTFRTPTIIGRHLRSAGFVSAAASTVFFVLGIMTAIGSIRGMAA